MKIEHEIPHVPITRYSTLREALRTLGIRSFKGTKTDRAVHFLAYAKTKAPIDSELAMLSEVPLAKEYEGAYSYEQTLGLTRIQKGVFVRDFYAALATTGDYVPASTSAIVAYVLLVAEKNVAVDSFLHLGTFLRDEQFLEKRLITAKDGSAKLLSWFPEMRMPYEYGVVVAKKDNKTS